MKNMPVREIIFVLLLFTPFFVVKAQSKEKGTLNLSGNILLDSRLAVNYYDSLNTTPVMQQTPKRSQYLAGLMSLVLPGAGEAYSGNYLKTAIFLVVEAAAITTALIYNHKGDTQTGFFQNFANQNWSVVRYAKWTLNNIKNINADVDASLYQPGGSKQVLIYGNGVNSDPTGVNWSNLNALESDLGAGYSHQLPSFGQQQYYELIGKYPQYSHGWDDSNQMDTDFHNLSYNFLWYAHQRGLANEYYKTGSFGVGLIYVNHVLSALDAVWSMDKYNHLLAANIRLNGIQMADHVELIPTLNLSFNF
jgi:hypothetical protein